MSETTQKEFNGTANDSKSPKDEKEKKTSVAFNDMISTRMQVEEENVPFKGSSKLSSSKSKIKLLVGGIVFVILIIIIIVLMLPKTVKQNDYQLWTLTEEFKLDNSYSSIGWKFEDKLWTIPSEDKEGGHIAVKDSDPVKVLAINGEEVILEDKAENSKSSQLWVKGSENSDGYFSLKNKESGKYLTVFVYTSRLWSLSADSRLINLYSSGKVFQENQWTMPTEGAEGGYVEVTTKKGEIEQTTIPSEAKKVKVLAINITDLEDKVELQDKADNLLSSQIWIKGPENSDGYFTLKNKGTEKFLQGDKTPMTSVKDFILGEEFDGSLGVGSSYGINVGGASALDGVEDNGVRGCTGKLIITPPFKKGNIEKTKDDDFVEVFKIRANRKKDKKRTKKITVQGTCCWEIYSRTGDSQKNIRPGQTLTPSVAYIKKLKTKKC